MRWTLLGLLGAFVVLVIIGAAVGGGTSTKSASDTGPLTDDTPASRTVTVTATPSHIQTSRTRPTHRSAISRHPAASLTRSAHHPASKTTHESSDDGSFTMPNEVGNVLQNAQDNLQRVSGDPVFFSHSHDLLGDRFQILDSDWKVCTQNVAPGATVAWDGHIDFGVVKLYETCP